MTDINRIVRMLRVSESDLVQEEAADALEAQAEEIDALNEKIKLLNTDCSISSAYIKQLEADNSDLSSRCQYLFSLLPEEMQNRLILRSVALQKEKAQ